MNNIQELYVAMSHYIIFKIFCRMSVFNESFEVAFGAVKRETQI